VANASEFILPSRLHALKGIVPALRAQLGLVLLTGDAGLGKTWLSDRVQEQVPSDWRGITIAPSPANGPADLYRMIGHALGLPRASDLCDARLELASFLEVGAADGTGWFVTIDEVQGASVALLDEVRLLSNRLGQADGFAGLMLLGQTEFARRLATRPLAALDRRIAARVHLRRLDIEELRSLLTRIEPDAASQIGGDWEQFYQQSNGNPKRALDGIRLRVASEPRRLRVGPAATSRLTTPEWKTTPRPSLSSDRDVAPSQSNAGGGSTGPGWKTPVLGESKPPLRMEDGMIEVGWAPESEETSEAVERDEGLEVASALSEMETHQEESLPEEETIHDRYAALQAWEEWTRNEGRAQELEVAPPSNPSDSSVPPPLSAGEEEEFDTSPLGQERDDLVIPPGVWAEQHQDFAPYGQLFTRARHPRDA